jgi:hypothetical protein
MAPLTDQRIAKQYDAIKFAYLGSAADASRFCAKYRTSKVKTFADARTASATIGATGGGGATSYFL